MNKMTFVFAAVVIAVAVLLSPSIVQAAFVSAQTDIWMDTFTITATGVTWDTENNSVSDGLPVMVSGWGTPVSIGGPGNGAAADGGGIAASSSVNVSPWGYAIADYLAQRLGTFTVAGTGSISITAVAHFAQTMITSGLPSAFGATYGVATLMLADSFGNVAASSWGNAIDTNGDAIFDQQLNVTMDFAQGGTGNLTASVESYSYASVPEPSTMLLLGFGLAGMLGFGRKKSSAV